MTTHSPSERTIATAPARYHVYFYEKLDWTDLDSRAWKIAQESNEADITLTLAEAATICRGARCECEIFDLLSEARIGSFDIEGHYTPTVGANLLEAAKDAHAGIAKLVLEKIARLWVTAAPDSRVLLRQVAGDLLGQAEANKWLAELTEQARSREAR